MSVFNYEAMQAYASRLLQVVPGGSGGKYPVHHALRLHCEDGVLYGNYALYGQRYKIEHISTLEELQAHLETVPEGALEYLESTLIPGVEPTYDNAVLWRGPSKLAFLDQSSPTEVGGPEGYLSPITGEQERRRTVFLRIPGGQITLRLLFRFYVTSFDCGLAIRASDCPEACVGSDDMTCWWRELANAQASDDWQTIASAGWMGNGSSFDKKYEEAFTLINRTLQGEWDDWRHLTQDNRSTSRSASGDDRTRFWSAPLTRPMLAQAALSKAGLFPLQACKRKPAVPTYLPTAYLPGAVVESKLHPH